MNIGYDKDTTPATFFTGLIDDVRIYAYRAHCQRCGWVHIWSHILHPPFQLDP